MPILFRTMSFGSESTFFVNIRNERRVEIWFAYWTWCLQGPLWCISKTKLPSSSK